MVKIVAALSTIVVVTSSTCDPKRTYAQCGGFSYKGEKCCPTGWGCSYQQDEYSACTTCAKSYGQCGGGPGYNGSTCCISGFKCEAHGSYYKGCVEEKGCPNSLFDTCGGQGFKGNTCCPHGSGCRKDVDPKTGVRSKYHSMCQSCADKAYMQCGGHGWTGARCCTDGFDCNRQNSHYYQCEPSKKSAPTAAGSDVLTSNQTTAIGTEGRSCRRRAQTIHCGCRRRHCPKNLRLGRQGGGNDDVAAAAWDDEHDDEQYPPLPAATTSENV